ncbi:lipid-A-disaccharide synthase [Microbulbifer thermotolerans]|uniref:Lipid-A-disaccharide synthase n=1 Tax=Microbulbifer thermotolerans TaxID=252514 RepID=A0A143HKH5_MICTH|nr:lipid-A-disaccharide synthase [Microbulbifer thermotolerans]AMX02229.1 lipid-A-disaccharide synthase [Microbulbifer thermotolerans]MCX2778795.1 lipid-A-disaccharide synthase [Microbulbifer thermotolerans]MCX2781933.1 lipid-A-disaccharide synthase [Microbulbifer thermotolerans]MCX2793681.1 lipid-A-disaccharide synthase [Microbulbifer thermotolerans]MCX2800865.1 lipid-A-disaccharide synthase [Microbulbifer thermotolerans]
MNIEEKTLRIGIVAGEVSGDILGAGLIEALQKRVGRLEVEGIAGPRMLSLGARSLFPMERLSVMGLVEPLKRLPELLKIRRALRQHFIDNPPDLFVGIDSPDFNLTLEESLKAAGIPTLHYVSPSVWAWRRGRIKKIARAVDHMLTLLPFEASFYEEHGVPVTFVGHPLADEIPLQVDMAAARRELGFGLEERVIALLPGSRGGEVRLLGPLFLQAARWCHQRCPELKFILPAANDQRLSELKSMLGEYADLPVRLQSGNSHKALAAADAVLIASGTATLETMLLKRPMVVAYKMASLSYAIFSRMLRTPWVALPNLLAQRELVPEILQEDATPENLGAALLRYFEDPLLVDQLQREFDVLHQQLRRNASERAADAVCNLLGVA